MRNIKNYIIVIAFFPISFYSKNVFSQSSFRDTVYVNDKSTTEVKFMADPDDVRFLGTNAEYVIQHGTNSIIIFAKKENSKSDILKVEEGGRVHHFSIVFKEGPAAFIDLSSKKKIDQHNNELEARNSNKKIIENKKEITITPPSVNIEKEKQAQEAIKNKKYLALITEANNLTTQKNYLKARDRYQQAADIKPGDAYALGEIEKINKAIETEELRKSQANALETFANVMRNADKAFNQGEFVSARIFYTQALTYKPGDPTATSRIQAIDIKEKQKQESADLENNYKAAMSAGDKYFEVGDLDNAKIQYNKAYGFIKRSEPQEQIKKINKQIADNSAKALADNKKLERERENDLKYKKLVDDADAEFNKQNYSRAKQLFTSASTLKPSDPHPVDMLTKIEIAFTHLQSEKKLKDDNAAKALADNKKLELEKANELQYKKLVDDADAEFNKQNYSRAKQLFTSASNLKPSDRHPVDMLTKIEIALTQIQAEKKIKDDNAAREKETNKLYTAALLKGKSFFQKGDLENAKTAYTEAGTIKPLEEEPGKQLAMINQKLADIENNKKYEAKMSEANNLLANAIKQRTKESLQLALTAYTEASSLKPGESYTLKQINYVKSTMASIEETNKRNVLINKQNEENKKLTDAISRGATAQREKRYQDALTAYQEAQQISYNKDIDQIIHNLQYNLEQTKEKPIPEKKKKGKKNK